MHEKIDRKKVVRWDELPDVLTAQDIADYEKVSRTRVYELFDLSPKCGGIPNYSIGISRRVEKGDFDLWRKKRKEEANKKFA